jgi:hypothetical protein
MFFIGAGADEVTDEHEGYVAGRYRDGSVSDIWTNVARCAHDIFIGYRPACECGWSGAWKPCTEAAYQQCQQDWATHHFVPEVLPLVRRPVASGAPTTVSSDDFDFTLDRRRLA